MSPLCVRGTGTYLTASGVNALYTVFIIVIIAAAASQDAMAEIRSHGLSSRDYKHVEHLLTTQHLTTAQAPHLQ